MHMHNMHMHMHMPMPMSMHMHMHMHMHSMSSHISSPLLLTFQERAERERDAERLSAE